MKVGTLVRYAQPQGEYEAHLIFVVIDDRGDRSLIQAIGDGGERDYSIIPNECVADTHLAPAR